MAGIIRVTTIRDTTGCVHQDIDLRVNGKAIQGKTAVCKMSLIVMEANQGRAHQGNTGFVD